MREEYREILSDLRERHPGRSALTVTETAQELSVSRKTLEAAIKASTIRAVNIGSGTKNYCWRISLTEIARKLA